MLISRRPLLPSCLAKFCYTRFALLPTHPARNAAALILAAGIIYLAFFSRAGALGLVGPDEPRYASVARAMAETGDAVTPRLHGEPWFEKPILYYWLAAIAFQLFGVSEAAARLPSAFLATLATLGLAWLARRRSGDSTAWLVLVLLPTSVGMFGFARGATTDMPFSALLTLALIAVDGALSRTRDSSRSRPPYGWLVALGAVLGLATLAKGPAAVLLAGGSTLLWAAVTRRWREAFGLLHPVAVVSFLVTALPWYVLCALRNPDFVRVFLIAHNWERFFTPVFQHQQPFWFFGPILLLGLAPWSLLLLAPLRQTARRWPLLSREDSTSLLFACWVVFPFVFFSASQSKLPGYILPTVPPLVVLLARGFSRTLEDGDAWARWLPVLPGLTVVGLVAASGHWLRRLPQDLPASVHDDAFWLLSSLAVTALAAVAAAWFRRPFLSVGLVALSIAAALEVANRSIVPQLDSRLSARHAAEVLRQEANPRDRIALFRVHRAWEFGLEFYLGRSLPGWDPANRETTLLVTSSRGLEELVRAGVPIAVMHHVSNNAIVVRRQVGPAQ
jgi:4-amino-4-deoxy-L-arabinose transferase-like glycosyltransferase